MSVDGVTATIASRSITIGDGTVYCWGQAGIDGLGQPPVRNNDVVLLHNDGAVGQRDYVSVRQITFDLIIGPPLSDPTWTADQTWDAWNALRVAWATSNVDLALAIDLFGNTINFAGRPDGVDLDTSPMLKGLRSVRVNAGFRCPTPTQT